MKIKGQLPSQPKYRSSNWFKLPKQGAMKTHFCILCKENTVGEGEKKNNLFKIPLIIKSFILLSHTEYSANYVCFSIIISSLTRSEKMIYSTPSLPTFVRHPRGHWLSEHWIAFGHLILYYCTLLQKEPEKKKTKKKGGKIITLIWESKFIDFPLSYNTKKLITEVVNLFNDTTNFSLNSSKYLLKKFLKVFQVK